MPTIYEVAKEAHVSPSTVSRSFTDSDLLTDATRARVLEVARRLNYQPPHARLAAKALRAASADKQHGQVGQTIGFEFFAPSETATAQTDAFYAPMLAGAQAEAQTLGMHLLIYTTTRHSLPDELPRRLREQALAGLLLVGTADPEILAGFLAHVSQIVLLDNRDPQRRHDCVLSEGIGGAAEAARYLFSLGHERVAFVMSEPQTATFQDRLTGFLSAHFQAGRPVERDFIVAAQGAEEFAAQVERLLTRPDRPTAILAANDPHAYRVMQICHTLGLRIPQDLSVMGFDADQFSALSTPALTTMRVDTEYLGRLAVRRLLLRLQENTDGKTPELSVNMEVPVSLLVRASCGPV